MRASSWITLAVLAVVTSGCVVVPIDRGRIERQPDASAAAPPAQRSAPPSLDELAAAARAGTSVAALEQRIEASYARYAIASADRDRLLRNGLPAELLAWIDAREARLARDDALSRQVLDDQAAADRAYREYLRQRAAAEQAYWSYGYAPGYYYYGWPGAYTWPGYYGWPYPIGWSGAVIFGHRRHWGGGAAFYGW